MNVEFKFLFDDVFVIIKGQSVGIFQSFSTLKAIA